MAVSAHHFLDINHNFYLFFLFLAGSVATVSSLKAPAPYVVPSLSLLFLVSLFCLSASNVVFFMPILDTFFSLYNSPRVSSAAFLSGVSPNS